MSELDTQFEAAQAASKTLSERPDNDDMLEIYALFKQSSAGDVQGSRPGMMDFVGRAKYDAWANKKGLGSDEAKQAYIDKIRSLGADF